MSGTVVEHAPAKINLALHVTGRRSDGYHLIESLVVFAEAGDRVSARPAETDAFTIAGAFAGALDDQGDNLVTRARDLMRGIAGGAAPVAIALEKNLPVASGLGGGSSDAAATLRALRRLWGVDVAESALAEAALALGADLPMCLSAETLLVRGIGERLAPAGGLPVLDMVLVNPGVAVSTPSVFRALESRENWPLPALPPPGAFDDIVEWLARTRNDLERPALALAPEIGDALGALRASGAALARMSGSGATCFGLFASGDEAARAAAGIAAAQPSWYVKVTRTIERTGADGAH